MIFLNRSEQDSRQDSRQGSQQGSQQGSRQDNRQGKPRPIYQKLSSIFATTGATWQLPSRLNLPGGAGGRENARQFRINRASIFATTGATWQLPRRLNLPHLPLMP